MKVPASVQRIYIIGLIFSIIAILYLSGVIMIIVRNKDGYMKENIQTSQTDLDN